MLIVGPPRTFTCVRGRLKVALKNPGTVEDTAAGTTVAERAARFQEARRAAVRPNGFAKIQRHTCHFRKTIFFAMPGSQMKASTGEHGRRADNGDALRQRAHS